MEEKKVVLENEKLLIEVNEFGSELARIYDKENRREVLWDAKPEIWARRAPILFPFIGNCYEGKYRMKEQEYAITAHGFSRDKNFSLISKDAGEVWYSLEDNEDTYKLYPFHFVLKVGHRLEGNKIHVMWRVENTDSKELLFMLGGHPAFRTPEGNTIYDFTFEFDKKDSLHYQSPNNKGYADASKEGGLALCDGKVPLTQGFFDDVLTYIFDQGQVNRVSLLLPDSKPYVTVHCSGIPYLGVWTMEKTHPFVCLEPWYGRCSDDGFSGELKDREGIVCLGVGEGFQADYVIEIH